MTNNYNDMLLTRYGELLCKLEASKDYINNRIIERQLNAINAQLGTPKVQYVPNIYNINNHT